jgi:tripartite-type tricarboxylate transporter receptor subunit TctC
VRLIVAFAPGGPVDFVARTLAETLSRELGRPVLVDNKPGANGAIGAMETLKGEPDGSTVWITSVGAAAINPALYDKLPYDMVRDFTPVSLVVNNVEVLVTSAQNPATDVVDFVQRARAANVPVPMASSGMGSIPHLALLQMQEATKLDLLHVPFNGMAPALTNLLGGQVAGVFADVPAVMGQIKAGRLKALGMASRVRHPGLPEVRTFEEMGFPAVDTNNWYAFFVSSKTPRPIVDALNAATRRALADPAVANRLLQSGAEPRATTPEEMAALLRADTNKWAALIKARNIRLDS